MRAVVQRVVKADVTVEEKVTGSIDKGPYGAFGSGGMRMKKRMRVYLAEKIAGLRIFEDEEGKMNLSVKDVGGDLLTVSQFTLFGDCRKGKAAKLHQGCQAGKSQHALSEIRGAVPGAGTPC